MGNAAWKPLALVVLLLFAVGCARSKPHAPPPPPPILSAPAPPADALDVQRGLQVPDGHTVRITAWLWEPGSTCPPCPPDVVCTPCWGPESTFGSSARPTSDDDIHFLVHVKSELGEHDVGRQFVIEGEWTSGIHTRVFVARRVVRIAP